MPHKRLNALVAAITAVVVTISLISGLPSHASAKPTGSSQEIVGNPFLKATAVLSSNGEYTVAWTSRSGSVTVFASTTPAAAGGIEVGSGHGVGQIVVSGLSTATRWYFRLVAAGGRYVVIANRSLNLTHDPNGRDVGGYRTTEGAWVKVGMIYRSAQLCGLTSSEVAALNGLDLYADIDTRSSGEAASCPDPTALTAPYMQFPLIANTDPLLTLWGATTNAQIYSALEEQGGPGGSAISAYAGFALPYAVDETRQVFQQILAADGRPIVIHCSAGQDRTGWVIYVLLRLLGVATSTAMQDYLLSATNNAALYKESEHYFESIGFSARQAILGTEVDPQRIETALNSVDAVYGSFHRYLHLGLGLTNADISQLRATYDSTA